MVARAADTLGYDACSCVGAMVDDPGSRAQRSLRHPAFDFLLALRPGLISPVIAARMVSALDRLTAGRVRMMIVPGATRASSPPMACTSTMTSATR